MPLCEYMLLCSSKCVFASESISRYRGLHPLLGVDEVNRDVIVLVCALHNGIGSYIMLWLTTVNIEHAHCLKVNWGMYLDSSIGMLMDPSRYI